MTVWGEVCVCVVMCIVRAFCFFLVGVAACATWLLVAAVFRFSSLSALVATAAAPLYVWLFLGDLQLVELAAMLAVSVFSPSDTENPTTTKGATMATRVRTRSPHSATTARERQRQQALSRRRRLERSAREPQIAPPSVTTKVTNASA